MSTYCLLYMLAFLIFLFALVMSLDAFLLLEFMPIYFLWLTLGVHAKYLQHKNKDYKSTILYYSFVWLGFVQTLVAHLRISQTIKTSWVLLFLPMLIPFSLIFIFSVIGLFYLIIKCARSSSKIHHFAGIGWAVICILETVCIIIFVLLVTMKIDNTIQLSWRDVFSVIIYDSIFFAVIMLSVCIGGMIRKLFYRFQLIRNIVWCDVSDIYFGFLVSGMMVCITTWLEFLTEYLENGTPCSGTVYAPLFFFDFFGIIILVFYSSEKF